MVSGSMITINVMHGMTGSVTISASWTTGAPRHFICTGRLGVGVKPIGWSPLSSALIPRTNRFLIKTVMMVTGHEIGKLIGNLFTSGYYFYLIELI